MTDAAQAAPAVESKSSGRGKKGLFFGVIAALALGGGGFYAIYAGLFDPATLFSSGESAGDGHGGGGQEDHAAILGDIAFVPMEPILISLPPGGSARHLRFTGQLEVEQAFAAEVSQLMPRILDVLNTYLRAVEVRDLEQPASIPRLRAQMLRRIQVVTGEGRVRDLLITEFVLN